MKSSKLKITASLGIVLLSATSLFAQNTNCFLEDFAPKNAVIPTAVAASKTIDVPTVTVTLAADTLGKISKYVFGNALAVWIGNVTGEAKFVKNTQLLNPSLIRFPGGSWGDVFFFNGKPTDLPDSVYNGATGKKELFYPISGKNDWPTTTDTYYKLVTANGFTRPHHHQLR